MYFEIKSVLVLSHIEGNVFNGSLKFTKYNKRITCFVHGLFKFLLKDENKVSFEEEFEVGYKV